MRSLSTVELLAYKKTLASGSFGTAELWSARMYGVDTRKRKNVIFNVVVKKPLRDFNTFMDEFKLHASIYAKMRGKPCRRYIPEPYNIRGATLTREPMYAMELVEGDTLYEYYDDTKVTGEMVAEVQKALKCLHKIGCVHNDLHPNNILADNSNPAKPKIKLIDFGMTTCGLPKYSGTGSRSHARWMKRAHRTVLAEGGIAIKPNAMWMTTSRRGTIHRSCTHANYLKGRCNPRGACNFHVNVGKMLRKTAKNAIVSRSRSIESQPGSLASLLSRLSPSRVVSLLSPDQLKAILRSPSAS